LFNSRVFIAGENGIKAKKMNQNEEMVSENNEATENVAASQETLNNPEENGPVNESAKLQSELAEQKEKFIRLYSEFENFRRRTAKEKLEMIQSANEQLLKAFLPVANDKDLEGFFLIYNKFKKTLEQAGVKIMDVKSGSGFNADLHEAITQIPVQDDALKGKVVDVVENGYLLNEKVIRHAKVVIGSN
jgi:molecular chaperone GrpE